MRLRANAAALIAMLLSGFAGQVTAQSFGSVSNLPTPPTPATTVTPPPAASSSTDVPANPVPVAAAAAVPKPWVPAPFFSAPKIVSPPAGSVAAPEPTRAAGANVPPESTPVPTAFSSVSSAAGASMQANGSGPSLPESVAGGASSLEMAERIVVEKSKRRLLLLRGGDVIAAYPVKLGLNPYGHKQREGDFRTPEGSYYLSRRNPRSEFFLSVEVSYPSPEDRARALAAGVRPGGLIMIHGQPNLPRKSAEYYASNDWTDGCIAVSNPDMVDIWLRTRVGIPIEIKP